MAGFYFTITHKRTIYNKNYTALNDKIIKILPCYGISLLTQIHSTKLIEVPIINTGYILFSNMELFLYL